MKIDPHAALLAAQNLRTGDAAARGRQASVKFFAELKKASSTTTQDPVTANNNPAPTSVSQSHLREAPLRHVDTRNPLPPGSLLNIIV
ncbi:MAG: hypothetical protein JKY46_09040 [Robiginitomaculum sp.]|nr:hypothetical protein [Robiginitomaculum sp.]